MHISILFLSHKTAAARNNIDQGKYDYADALHKSFIFYEAQRSGKLPFKRLAWRGDSCLECRGPKGEDLSMGYYEAANTMKWGLPKASMLTMIAWGIVEFKDAYKSVNEYNEATSMLKWGTQYLINCHSSKEQFIGQYGDSTIDFQYFGPPELYEEWLVII